jgi:putative membrane protein
MRILLAFVVNALALAAAAWLLPGIHSGGIADIAWTAVIFGLVNALIRPFVKLLSCGFIVLTLGLFTLIINAAMLMLTAWIGRHLGIDFRVDSFLTAFLGALLISIVSLVLSLAVRPGER